MWVGGRRGGAGGVAEARFAVAPELGGWGRGWGGAELAGTAAEEVLVAERR